METIDRSEMTEVQGSSDKGKAGRSLYIGVLPNEDATLYICIPVAGSNGTGVRVPIARFLAALGTELQKAARRGGVSATIGRSASGLNAQ